MAISKVILNNEILMDVTQTTATIDKVINPYTAVINTGEKVVGNAAASNINVTNLLLNEWPNGNIYLDNSITTIGDHGLAYKPIVSINSNFVTSLGTYAFYKCTNLVTVNLPNLTSLSGESHFQNSGIAEFINEQNMPVATRLFQNCPNLKRIVLMGTINASANYWVQNNPLLEEIICPNATGFSPNGAGYQGNVSLNLIDIGDSYYLYAAGLPETAPLSIIIIRRANSVVAMNTPNGFDSLAFKTGGTGGYIYIPEAIYNHLGDGSSLDYESSTNWVTFLEKGTTTWMKLEGSKYESKEWWKNNDN